MIKAGGDGYDIVEIRGNISLTGGIIAPRDDGEIGGYGQTVILFSGNGNGSEVRGNISLSEGIVAPADDGSIGF